MARVVLTAFEQVVARGVQRVEWLVQVEGKWRRATDCGRLIEPDKRNSPSVVWQRIIELDVAVGTWFQRITTEPGKVQRQDPLAYLQSGRTNAAVRVSRMHLQLGPDGRLVRGTPPDNED